MNSTHNRIPINLAGDPGIRYSAESHRALVECRSEIADGKLPGLYWIAWCDSLPRQMKTVALAAAADPDGFLEYARTWNDEHATDTQSLPPPPDPNKDISLGVLSTEPPVDGPLRSQGMGSLEGRLLQSGEIR